MSNASQFLIRDAGPDDAPAISAMARRLIPSSTVGREMSAFDDYFSRTGVDFALEPEPSLPAMPATTRLDT